MFKKACIIFLHQMKLPIKSLAFSTSIQRPYSVLTSSWSWSNVKIPFFQREKCASLPGDFKLVCAMEAILKTALSALNNFKGDKVIKNNSYVDEWTHVAIIWSSIYWLRANTFKYIASVWLDILDTWWFYNKIFLSVTITK